MARQNLIEKHLQTRWIYRGEPVSFRQDTVRLPSGNTAKRDFLVHPGAVCVAPFVSRRRVLIERQYRYPIRETVLEFPAGKLDGEKPETCARRELLEETGYWPRRIKRIGSFWPTPAFADEIMHNYVAWDLQKRAAKLDEDESLEVLEVEFDQVIEWIRRGRIKDAKTIITALSIETFNLFPRGSN